MKKPVEIELKAHTDNPAICKEKLIALAGEGTAFSKDDSYWFSEQNQKQIQKLPLTGLRVRREKTGKTAQSEQCRVTWKNKKKSGRLEVNDEHEFEASNGEVFEELLVLLGMEKRISKHKEGWAWHFNGITAELCEVAGYIKPERGAEKAKPPALKNLGWFLELEILTSKKSGSVVAAARGKLLALLEKAGIAKGRIETRYYSELLAKPRQTPGALR